MILDNLTHCDETDLWLHQGFPRALEYPIYWHAEGSVIHTVNECLHPFPTQLTRHTALFIGLSLNKRKLVTT